MLPFLTGLPSALTKMKRFFSYAFFVDIGGEACVEVFIEY